MKKTLSDFKQINKTLIQYCSNEFQNGLNEGVELPNIFYELPRERCTLYLYPNSPEILAESAGIDLGTLTEAGWNEPSLCGKPFIVWYALKYVQLCEINNKTLDYTKPDRGLNKDIPYLYSLCSHKKEHSPFIAVVEDPIHATILLTLGIPAMACGSATPTKSQNGYLARMGCKLTYICTSNAKSEHAAELFVENLAKFVDVDVMFITNWAELFECNNLIDKVTDESMDGIQYLAKRILSKHNGKDDYSRSIEVIQIANKIGKRNHSRFLGLAKGYGSNNYAHYAESLHLMGDLIQANVPVETARKNVMDRYGVSIFIRDMNQVKLS